METSPGVIVLLVLFFIFNGWWIRKLLTRFRQRNLEVKRLSEPVSTAYKAYSRNDYSVFSALLPKLSRAEVYELQKCFSSLKVNSELLRRYAGEHNKEPAALYLLGANLVEDAWKARGTGTADTLRSDNVNKFFEYLHEADTSLRSVLTIAPDYAEAYAPLIRVQMGLGNRMESSILVNKAKEIAPGRLDYNLAMLMLLTEKWGGSHEQMFEFARNACANPVCKAGLIAAAHHEFWLSLEGREEKLYHQRQDVREELQSAYALLSNIPQEMDYQEKYQTMLALNFYAFCFMMMKEKKKCREVFRKIGKEYTPYPWSYLAKKPVKAYLDFRSAAGAGAV